MRRPAYLAAALILAAGGALAQAPAPVTPANDPVVARVDGQPILLSDVADAAQGLPEELRAAPVQMLYPLILDQLITQRAIVAAARRDGLDRDEQLRRRVARAEDQELQQALLSRELAGKISEEALRARYRQEIATRPAEEELRARHILVATETEARQALTEVRGGADFAEVARRRSSGPGARDGGDLGFFKRGDMVPEFAEAAFALQAGQISAAPVRSPFGWHVIKVEERRAAPPPPFEEVRDALRQQVVEAEITAVVERIRGAAQIERFNLDGSPRGALDGAAPPPGPAPARPGAAPAAPQPRR